MPIETLAVVLVLSAALLHAVTNALIKISGDPLITRGFMSGVSALALVPLLPFVSPPGREAWPFILGSVPLHTLYAFLIAAAYRRGDLSAVFPVARGVSPLAVAGLALYFGIGRPGWGQAAGVAIVCLGIFLIAAPGARAAASRRGALGYAFATGLVIASYTYLDALGLRAGGTIAGYIVWLVVLDGSCTAASVALARTSAVRPFLVANWKPSIAAALLGLGNFTLAMVALGLGPMVEIAALRETSVVFAAFIGSRYLGEAFGRRRLLAAGLVAGGVAAMQWLR